MVFGIFLLTGTSDWALFPLVLYFSPDRFWYPYIKFTTTFFGPIIGKPKFLILLEGDPKSANGCDFLAKTSENGFYQKNLGDPEVFIMFTPPIYGRSIENGQNGQKCIFLPQIHFYRTQVSLVRSMCLVSVTKRGLWNFTDLTPADEDTNWILTDNDKHCQRHNGPRVLIS